MVAACAERDRQGVIDMSTRLGFLTGGHERALSCAPLWHMTYDLVGPSAKGGGIQLKGGTHVPDTCVSAVRRTTSRVTRTAGSCWACHNASRRSAALSTCAFDTLATTVTAVRQLTQATSPR